MREFPINVEGCRLQSRKLFLRHAAADIEFDRVGVVWGQKRVFPKMIRRYIPPVVINGEMTVKSYREARTIDEVYPYFELIRRFPSSPIDKSNPLVELGLCQRDLLLNEFSLASRDPNQHDCKNRYESRCNRCDCPVVGVKKVQETAPRFEMSQCHSRSTAEPPVTPYFRGSCER